MTATRLAWGTFAVLLAATAGCGIRATDVPVDAGPAPTRATCDTPATVTGTGDPAEDTGTEAEFIELYLVCGSRVESVDRAVELPADTGDPLTVAAALLAELQAEPGRAEEAAGLTTEVPATLQVDGPAGNDPEQALRLSQRPNDLTAPALAQIICTFANSASLDGNGRTVVLGGPADSPRGQPRMYACTMAMRTSPESAARSPADRP